MHYWFVWLASKLSLPFHTATDKCIHVHLKWNYSVRQLSAARVVKNTNTEYFNLSWALLDRVGKFITFNFKKCNSIALLLELFYWPDFLRMQASFAFSLIVLKFSVHVSYQFSCRSGSKRCRSGSYDNLPESLFCYTILLPTHLQGW